MATTNINGNALFNSLLRRTADDGMNANQLMEAMGSQFGLGGNWNDPILEQIDAKEFADAYISGKTPTENQAWRAILNGEYVGTTDDYIDEVMSDLFGLEYGKESGFVSKGATPVITDPSGWLLSPDEVIANRNDALGIVEESDESSFDYFPGNTGAPSVNASGSSGTSPVTGGSVSGSYPTGMYTGGGDSAAFTATQAVPAKSGADVLAEYLDSLKLDSDFTGNLSASIGNLEDKYGTLFDDIRTGDYTQKPYYQTILDSYGIAGDAASSDAEASAAGANSGNLDSYAAANAKRQQLAYKNAAQSAALNAYNAEIGNMLQTLNDLGVNVNDLYATWAGDLNSQRSGAVNAYLGQLGADTDRYISDNTLAGNKYAADASVTQSQIAADANKYAADASVTQSQIAADANKYASDAQQAIAQQQSALDKYIAELGAQSDKYAADTQLQQYLAGLQSQENIAQLEAEQNRILAEMSSADEQKKIDLQKELAQLEVQKQQIQAETEKYVADNTLAGNKYAADVDKYLGELGLEGTKYQTDAQQAIAQQQSALGSNAGSNDNDAVNVNMGGNNAVSQADLESIASYMNYAQKSGASYDEATAYAWNQYIAKHPEKNNDNAKIAVYTYLANIFKPIYAGGN